MEPGLSSSFLIERFTSRPFSLDDAVNQGDRIAQLVLERIVTPDIIEVDELDQTQRGTGGFGSTGGFGETVTVVGDKAGEVVAGVVDSVQAVGQALMGGAQAQTSSASADK